MRLEDYFDLTSSGRILVKGTAVGIESLLEPWLDGYPTGDILRRYHSQVTLEQIYATVTYYLNQKPTIDRYLEHCRQNGQPAGVDDQGHDAPIRALRAYGLRGYLRTLDQPAVKA